MQEGHHNMFLAPTCGVMESQVGHVIISKCADLLKSFQ